MPEEFDRQSRDEKALQSRVQRAIEELIAQIPASDEPVSSDPIVRARALGNTAAANAALLSGGLALPPGPAGLLTIIPDLIAIWRIQGRMVADIAATFGKSGDLGRQQMLYCLFRHAASQALRDVVVRVGGRYLVRNTTLRALQAVMQRIGVKVSQRVIGKAVARWLPVVGAVGVGAYAYYDTAEVAKTAIDLFGSEIEVEPPGPAEL